MLQVSTTAAHKVNTLGTELSHGGLATHLELSLLDVDHHLSTSQTTLMTRITANTYIAGQNLVMDTSFQNNGVTTLPMLKKFQSSDY